MDWREEPEWIVKIGAGLAAFSLLCCWVPSVLGYDALDFFFKKRDDEPSEDPGGDLILLVVLILGLPVGLVMTLVGAVLWLRKKLRKDTTAT